MKRSNVFGFSIIETLVAITVLAAVSVMLQETTSTAISNSEHISQKIVSDWIARDRVVELRVKMRLMGELTDSDFIERETESLGVKYKSVVNVEKSTKYVQRLTVQVYTMEGDSHLVTSVTTYLPVIKGVI